MMKEDWCMTTNQLAELLGLKPQTLRMWRLRGNGPPYIRLVGPRGRVIYRASAVDEWLLSRTTGTIVGSLRPPAFCRSDRQQPSGALVNLVECLASTPKIPLEEGQEPVNLRLY